MKRGSECARKREREKDILVWKRTCENKKQKGSQKFFCERKRGGGFEREGAETFLE